MDTRVPEIKQLRKDIDAVLQRVKALPLGGQHVDHDVLVGIPFIATSIVQEKLIEASMWLGQCLKNIGEADPYPHSRNATSHIIEPTADGLSY